MSAANHAVLAGRSFFPHLISAPFRTGLHEAFLFAILACLVAAGASLLRGGKYHYGGAFEASIQARRAARANYDSRGAACALSGLGSPRFT